MNTFKLKEKGVVKENVSVTERNANFEDAEHIIETRQRNYLPLNSPISAENLLQQF